MIKFNSKKITREAYTIVGYAMYEKGMTKEELDSLDGINILLLRDEFEEWLEKEKFVEER